MEDHFNEFSGLWLFWHEAGTYTIQVKRFERISKCFLTKQLFLSVVIFYPTFTNPRIRSYLIVDYLRNR
jgi:hypothetical protein